MTNVAKIIFPKGFLWGAATASHQVEGDNYNDWSEWEKSPKRLQFLQSHGLIAKHGLDNFISGEACDHYHRYKEDFSLAQKLGHKATRFSIEWSRVEPREGVFDDREVEHYRDVVAAAKGKGLEPFVTLWHWPIPVWLSDKGGWECRDISNYFARYVEKIVSAFGGEVKYWLTLNEPEIYAGNSYFTGVWPPQKKNLFSYLLVTRNLLMAHRRAYKIIKKQNLKAQVGIANNNIYFEAYHNKLVNRAVKNICDWWWNFFFINQIVNQLDFVGLNHYFHNRIDYGFNKNENERISDLGWELYPEAMYHVLMDLKRYNKPIYITENGLADANDEHRTWFLTESLRYIHKAMDDGVDIRGYLHWSLMDNFEWDKGFWPRFGLLEIDYKTLRRKARPSAYVYREICLKNGIMGGCAGKTVKKDV